MHWLWIAVSLGIVGGIFLRGIYGILRLRRGALDSPAGYIFISSPLNYLSLNELLSNRNRTWHRYILFRVFPPLIVGILLVGWLQKLFPEQFLPQVVSCIVCIIAFYVPDLFVYDFGAKYISEKILYIFTIILMVFSNAVVLVLSYFNTPIYLLVPALNNIRDNIWSALTAAVIVALYINATDMSRPAGTIEQRDEQNNRNNYRLVKQRCEEMEARYHRQLDEIVNSYGLERNLVISLLAYEDLNRPAVIRFFEQLVVRFLPVTLTIGIAQVRSSHTMSDEESILEMGRILKNLFDSYGGVTNEDNVVRKVLTDYNGGTQYASNVLTVFSILNSECISE